MKVKTDCNKCRKQIAEQAAEEYAHKEYAIFHDSAFTFAVYATVAALTAQIRRGRSKDYINKLYDDMVMIYDTQYIFGKAISLTDMKNTLEKEYGIDFQRINVHVEDEKSFVKALLKKGVEL